MKSRYGIEVPKLTGEGWILKARIFATRKGCENYARRCVVGEYRIVII